MALIELLAKPKIVGMYLDMRPQYDLELPYPGLPVQETYHGFITVEELEERVAAFKAYFDDDQARSLLRPSTIHDVGYYVDGTLGLVYLYQIVYHGQYVAPA